MVNKQNLGLDIKKKKKCHVKVWKALLFKKK